MYKANTRKATIPVRANIPGKCEKSLIANSVLIFNLNVIKVIFLYYSITKCCSHRFPALYATKYSLILRLQGFFVF